VAQCSRESDKSDEAKHDDYAGSRQEKAVESRLLAVTRHRLLSEAERAEVNHSLDRDKGE